MGTDAGDKRTFFDHLAHRWHPTTEAPGKGELLARVLDALPLPRGATVLDLCTGTGVAVPGLLERAGRSGLVLAVDLSAEMLLRWPRALARRRAAPRLLADGYRLPLRTESAHLVFCLAGLAHFADPGAVVAEAARVLRPDGRLCVLFLSCRHHIDRLHHRVGGTVAHDRVPPLAEMEALFRASGLWPEYLVNERERLYLAVGRKRGEVRLEERVAELARGQLLRYPAARAEDLYKALHQSVLGPEHALGSPEAAWSALQREAAALEPGAAPGTPLVEDLTVERHVVRVHLAPYLAAGLPLEHLFRAFVEGAPLFSPTEDAMERAWAALERAAADGGVPGAPPGLQELGAEARARGFPALHHSDAFRRAYAPAYRLLCPAAEGLPPVLSEHLARRRPSSPRRR